MSQAGVEESRVEEHAGVTYLRERIGRIPVGELILAGPRTFQFLTRSASRHLRRGDQRYPDIPTRLMTFGTAMSVLIDEVMLAYMATTRLNLGGAELDRIAQETIAGIEMLEAAGVYEDPTRLHPEPPVPTVRTRRKTYRGVRYEQVAFESGYKPVVDLPGTTRWLTVASNQIAYAYVLRHRKPRPWIVNLHGFGMGNPADLLALRALHYHRDLGLNVIQPVFPTHGPRSAGPDGEPALTLDYLNNVHAFSQAIRDVRSIMAWARTQHGAEAFAVHGVSMGGYLAALLAGLVDDLDCVIAGVPTVDLAWVMRRSVPDDERDVLDARGLLGSMADRIHQPISPLSFEPRLPASRRFVYAGVADRIATPAPAHELWEHWDRSSVLWYRGSHIGFAWSREVRQFIDDALHQTAMTSGLPR